MEDVQKLLGKRIRTLRQTRNMTQQKLGDEAEMNYKYLGAVERGERNPSVNNLAKIAAALKVDLYEILIFERETEVTNDLKREINEILKSASKKEYGMIYKVIKAIMK